MSRWYDPHAHRYRTSLVNKIFHEWGWHVIRPVLFRLPHETAHHAGIRGIWLVGKIDRAWQALILVLAICAILTLRLLAFLPGFSWNNDSDEMWLL
jgi:hypothetical protein